MEVLYRRAAMNAIRADKLQAGSWKPLDAFFPNALALTDGTTIVMSAMVRLYDGWRTDTWLETEQTMEVSCRDYLELLR